MEAGTQTKKWICESCGFIYDPEEGDPDGDIAPGHCVRGHPGRLVLPRLRRAQEGLRPLRVNDGADFAALRAHHPGVAAAEGEQLLVRAELGDPPVRRATAIWSASRTVERRWAMVSVVRPRESASSACLHGALGLGVQGAGRLVEDQDRRVAQDGAGDGEALLLAAGEAVAALADDGVVAVGQRGDVVVDLGARARRRSSSASRGVRLGEAQVLARRRRGRGRSPARRRRRRAASEAKSGRARRRRRW